MKDEMHSNEIRELFFHCIVDLNCASSAKNHVVAGLCRGGFKSVAYGFTALSRAVLKYVLNSEDVATAFALG